MGVLDGDVIENYENGKPQTIANYDQGVLKNNKFLQITENGTCFLVYNENFVKNKKYWEYKGANGTLVVNSNNTISLKITPGRTVSGGIYADFSPKGEHIISILTHRKPKDENIIGLLFGFKDWDNYCGLYISGNKYVFQYIKNGRKMTAQEWKSSPAIEPETNNLTIVSSSSKTSLIINNETVEEYNRIDYAGAFCCVTGVNEGNEECYFDAANLTVSELVDSDNLPKEYLPKPSSGDSWTASGSGFFLSEDGYVATNHHVIKDAKVIEVSIVRNGEWEHHPAKVVLSDKQNDLSILKIEDSNFKNLPPIPYNFTTRIQDTGSEVFTLGYPIAEIMGDEVKFTDGKISSKSGIHGDATVYQISVPIQPGNSGGPLFDTKGNLVGITSSCLNRDYFKSENVNYAIKSSYLKALVDKMPRSIHLQDKADIADYPLTEKIKKFQSYMTYIKVK
jgi:S1-C subfamily serine protease